MIDKELRQTFGKIVVHFSLLTDKAWKANELRFIVSLDFVLLRQAQPGSNNVTIALQAGYLFPFSFVA